VAVSGSVSGDVWCLAWWFDASVDGTSASNASTATYFGVSGRGAKELAMSGVVVSRFHASHDTVKSSLSYAEESK
jgi:hypothetical protein